MYSGQMKSRSLGVILFIAALIGLTGCTSISAFLAGIFEKPRAIVLQDRVKTEWQSIAATKVIVDQGQIPTTWDAAVFIGSGPLSTIAKRFEGLQATYTEVGSAGSGSTITVTKVDVTPTVGALEASITLTGKSPSLGLTLDVQVDAIARYQGILPNESGKHPLAQFKWIPMVIRPGVNWGPLSIRANGYAATLLAEAAEYLARPDVLLFSVPVHQHITADSGLPEAKTDTIPIPSTNGSISFLESMPAYKVKLGSSNIAAVFTDYGVWLVSRIAKGKAALPTTPDIPDIPADQLQQQIAAMRSALTPVLSSANPGAVDLRAFIGASTFSQLIASINSIPNPNRTLTLQVTAHQNKLAEVNLHDDHLGSIDAYVELASDNGTHATIGLGQITGSWSEKGLDISTSITAHMESSLHFHVTPPITGGIGTTIGLIGDASVTMPVHASPMFLSDGTVSSVAILAQAQSIQIPITIKTDGALKVDFGWMSVPSVGVLLYLPAFNNQQAPDSIFDSRPYLASALPKDTDTLHFDQKTPYWKYYITPTRVNSSSSGLQFDATFATVDLPQPATADGLKAAQLAVDSEIESVKTKVAALVQANMQAATPLPPAGDPQLIIGPILLGPNNDIVKFFVSSFDDFVNGPTDSNDLVKAGYYVGSLLKSLDPTGGLTNKFLSDSDSAAKAAFGNNSVAYSAVAHIDQEVSNVLNNPAKAVLDLPSDVIATIPTLGKQAVDVLTGVYNSVGNGLSAAQSAAAQAVPGVAFQVGNNGQVTAKIGNTGITTGSGPGLGVSGSVGGWSFHL
jgi:hypothetical protein